MNRPWKIVIVLLGIFIAGGVAGAFIALAVDDSGSGRRSAPDQWIPARLRHMTERLELTPVQVEKIRPIMKREGEELSRLREQGFRETRVILERMEKNISAELTPVQRTKFDELNKEIRERIRRKREGGSKK